MAIFEGRMPARAPKLLTKIACTVLLVLVLLPFTRPEAATTVSADMGGSNNELISDVAAAATTAPQVEPVAVPEETAPAPASVSTPAPQIAPVSACTPEQLVMPAAIDLQGLPVGLTIIDNGVQTYRIYGNTDAQVREQLQRCAPTLPGYSGRYAGAASYNITWNYRYSSIGDGLCQVHSSRVGLRTAILMPAWSAGEQAAAGLASRWSSFYDNLYLHERGHVVINTQHAQQMLAFMDNFPAESCATIRTSIDSALRQRGAAIKAAHNAYDAQTSHGLTQGARF